MDDLRPEKWSLQFLRYALNFASACVCRRHAGPDPGGGVALAGSELALEEIWPARPNGPASMTGAERNACLRYTHCLTKICLCSTLKISAGCSEPHYVSVQTDFLSLATLLRCHFHPPKLVARRVAPGVLHSKRSGSW